jgi:hypothetical protein
VKLVKRWERAIGFIEYSEEVEMENRPTIEADDFLNMWIGNGGAVILRPLWS